MDIAKKKPASSPLFYVLFLIFDVVYFPFDVFLKAAFSHGRGNGVMLCYLYKERKLVVHIPVKNLYQGQRKGKEAYWEAWYFLLRVYILLNNVHQLFTGKYLFAASLNNRILFRN